MATNDYANHVMNIYASGVTMVNMAVGKKMGLFTILCDADKPLTSHEIADKGEKKERYVREWLNSMVVAKIIQLETKTDGNYYSLTDGQKQVLTSCLCIAPFALVLGERANPLMDCFKKDGPYSIAYEEGSFFETFEGFRRDTGQADIDVVIKFLEKRNLITRLEHGINVLDLGCGTGYYTAKLAKRFPSSHFTGVDLSKIALAIAEQKEQDLPGLKFQLGDAHALSKDWMGTYDLVLMFDTLHDLPDPTKVLSEIHRILKPDGSFMLCELGFHSDPNDNIGNVMAHFYNTLSVFICVSCGMSAEPREGKGACWGMENMKKVLTDCQFSIEDTCLPSETSSLVVFHCTKA